MDKLIPSLAQRINVIAIVESAKQVFIAVFVDSYESGDPVENGLYKEIAAKFGEIIKLLYMLRDCQTKKVGDNTNES